MMQLIDHNPTVAHTNDLYELIVQNGLPLKTVNPLCLEISLDNTPA
jgi:hypothetical protein